jgi:hypothetical protein
MIMSQEEFLEAIYDYIKIGMEVRKPNKISKILDVTPQGHIYYLIGSQNKKAVTKNELIQVYNELNSGYLSMKKLRSIVTKSKPCNVTTIKWILSSLDLAYANGKDWKRTW